MLNCQISMSWGLKKKPNFSGVSVKEREVATPHQNTCEHASCKRHRANLECAGTRACQKVVVKSLTEMDFDGENSFFNPKIHFYRTSFSLIKTTGGNGSVLQILTCLWVLVFFFFSLVHYSNSVRWWNLKKHLFTGENYRNWIEKSMMTGSDLRSLPTSTATRTGGLCFAAQAGHNF